MGMGDALWGLVALGVSGVCGYSIRTSNRALDRSDKAVNLSEKNKIEIDNMKDDLEAVKKMPERLAVVETTMKGIDRTLKTIESHLIRGQRRSLQDDDSDES